MHYAIVGCGISKAIEAMARVRAIRLIFCAENVQNGLFVQNTPSVNGAVFRSRLVYFGRTIRKDRREEANALAPPP